MVYDITIVGGGIVGLATAYQLLNINSSLSVLLLEKESEVAKHQTGNNSGVIHSGIYYKPGSLKAKNCIEGYNLLLNFCEENSVPYEICGKIIVATEESQLKQLEMLYERGNANGLKGIKYLTKEELKEYEPYVAGIKGLHVPQTGIINYKNVSSKLKKIIEAKGVEIKFNNAVKNIKKENNNYFIETNSGNYKTKYLVTCGGLMSDRLAKMTHPEIDFRIIPFRGEYYKLKKEKEYLIKNLIYPVPDPAFPFLGVHFTRMLDGGIEAGPNAVLAFKREGYKKQDFNIKDTFETFSWYGFHSIIKKYWKTGLEEFYRSFSKKTFVKELKKLIHEVEEVDLEPGGAGVRAQACHKSGGLIDDFLFVEGERILHVCNAPSPAATSSLAIGKTIADKVMSNV